MTIRIVASLILILSIFYMPFWVSVLLVLAGMIYFAFFLEGVVFFLISDFLFGVKEARFLNIFIVSFLISFLVLILIEFLKKKIRFSKEKIK